MVQWTSSWLWLHPSLSRPKPKRDEFAEQMIPQNWPLEQFLAVGTLNYSYKFLAAILMTPLIYLAHYLIDRYLADDADRLKLAASEDHGHW